MNFTSYAEENYVLAAEEGILPPEGFANSSKVNQVYGDQKNSLASPLRVEFYSEAAMCIGGIVAFAEVTTYGYSDTPGQIAIAGAAGVMAAAGTVRHRARSASQKVFRQNKKQ